MDHIRIYFIDVASVASKKSSSVVARDDSEDLIRKGYLEEEKAESTVSVAENLSNTDSNF